MLDLFGLCIQILNMPKWHRQCCSRPGRALAKAKDAQTVLGDEDDRASSLAVMIVIEQTVKNVLVLRRPKYHGAQTGKTC
jgi:hypothetical protein